LAVGRKREIARRVATPRNAANQFFRFAARFEVAVMIREADHGNRVADVDPLGIPTRRIKRDPKWIRKPGREYRRLLRFAILRNAPENADFAGIHFRDEQIAVWRLADLARTVEALRIPLHFKSLGRLRPRTFGLRDDMRAI